MSPPSRTSSLSSISQDGATVPTEPSTPPDTPTKSDAPAASFNPSVAMTVTPASAAASSTASLASTRSKPKHHLHSIKTQSICPPDPEYSPSPRSHTSPSPSNRPPPLSDRTFFERSPSPHSRPSLSGSISGSMAETFSSSKSPGLIRRLSRGAHSKLRRRASQQHSLRMRDQSAGPVLVRRRSDSNGASEFTQDVSDFELDNPTDSNADDPPSASAVRDRMNGLGINIDRPSNASSQIEEGMSASVSAILQTGTWATKHTNKNKKNKRLRLWLDPNSARVCWHPTNLAKSFFIDDVREIRKGAESRNARDDVQIADEHEGRWMTIVYEPPERSKARTIKTMHLVFDSAVVVKYWHDAMDQVARKRIQIMNALAWSTEKSEKSMEMVWEQAMSHKSPGVDHVFTLEDARWFCKQLEINCSDHAVRTHFARSDVHQTGFLDYPRYQEFVNSFKERKDIQNLYRNITYGTGLDMDMHSFLTFLKNDQCVNVDKNASYWESVYEKFAKPIQNRPVLPDAEPTAVKRMINMQSFQSFITSGYNSPITYGKNEPLDRPLNEYFISSSHNTYLLGRQVRGLSSVEGYIATLIKGCRCVEIDCWDGEGGRPMVTHGRTMTTKVPFEDCVSSVAKYAFHTSPYPLIVSLEVHCNSEQQKAMVDIMTRHWEGMLITEPINDNDATLPSPEELKGKILVKVKAAAAEDSEYNLLLSDGLNGRNRARSLGSTFVRTPSFEKNGFTSTPLVTSPDISNLSETQAGSVSTPRGSTTSGPTLTPSSSADDSEDNLVPPEKLRRRKPSNIVPELGRLGVYTQGIKFPGSFNESDSKVFNHVFSFNENTFNSKTADMKALMEKHNTRYLMRVYPKAQRVDSSNFNPLEVWRRGAQMAALNWQTYDVPQQINEAMFASGPDRVGYVLKPEQLRPAKHLPIADTIPTSFEMKDKKDKKFVKFSVDIISAQRLPRLRYPNSESGMNVYVEFEMYLTDDKTRGVAYGEGGTDASVLNGYHGTGSVLRKRTKIVEGNAFDPIFNQSLSMTAVTKHPSLIFCRWTVWSSPDARSTSSSNTQLASFTAKLSSLQQGYRHLPLFNDHGEQYRDAKLFVKIRKEASIPLQVDDNAYGIIEAAGSPRVEPIRPERNWRSRVFSRNSSQRRLAEQHSDDMAGVVSRTSSMDRDSMR